MRKLRSVLLILISLFAFSCNTKPENETLKHHEQTISSAEIQLDHGEKWVANAETTEGIKIMQNICSHYNGDVAQLENTYLSLFTEFNLIFERCTMTGEAHEQLHAFLIPVKNQLAILKDCKADCDKEIKYLEEYLLTYDKYFK